MEKHLIINKPFELPKNRLYFMSAEMEEIHRHFSKIEQGQEKLHSNIQAGQEKLHSKIQMVEESVKDVKIAVVGNPPLGVKGLAERMQDMEDWRDVMDHRVAGVERVAKLEERMKFYDSIFDQGRGISKAATVLWMALGGFLGWVVSLVFQYFVK